MEESNEEITGVYKNIHDGKKYRVSMQVVKKTKYYFMECINSKVKKGKYNLELKFFNQLLSLNHFQKLKQL